jgi:hypothetical protein
MSAPIQRDYLTEFVAFLAKTPGRDKICRTIQYASKFLKWVEESKLADAKKPSVLMLFSFLTLSLSLSIITHPPPEILDRPGLTMFSTLISSRPM